MGAALWRPGDLAGRQGRVIAGCLSRAVVGDCWAGPGIVGRWRAEIEGSNALGYCDDLDPAYVTAINSANAAGLPVVVASGNGARSNQIADVVRDKIKPIGVAVVVEATHLCMSMRGVEKQNSFAVTSAMHGAFRNNARTRMEFLELIKLRSAVPGVRESAGYACIGED